MRTDYLHRTAVAVGIVIIVIAGMAQRATAQTVTWERKAFGQQQTNGCGDPFTWPNNNFWSQDQLILTACNSNYVAEPSNWSTPGFPNSASVDVITLLIVVLQSRPCGRHSW